MLRSWATHVATIELKEGAVIADKFRLIRLLGQGGMGEVWAAQHTSLDIPCAVKFIHAESASKPEVRERFEREAKAAAQLRTPNVVQILDYGVFENTPYIAMEYLDGEPLNARLKRRHRLDPFETFRIITGVGKALTRAHRAGIVHRDLKPENIFLVVDEDNEVPKVLDFGVAKQTTTLDSNTRTGALLGTPYFMSPEQAQGTKAVDHRADLWSLAVVVYRCITGELPFKSEALGDLLIKIVTQPAPVPSQVCAGIPDGFDAWWARASQRDPAYRFQSAKELVEALGMALNVTAPNTLGTTPMPAHQPPPGGQTVIADPITGSGMITPFGQSGASQQMNVHPTVGSYPGVVGTGPHMPVQPHMLGDSHNAGSVAGLSAGATAVPMRSSNKGLLVGVIAGIVVVGGIGGVLLFSGGGEETAAAQGSETSATTTASPTEDLDAVEEAEEEVEEEEVQEAASAEPEESAEPADTAPKTTTQPKVVKNTPPVQPKQPDPVPKVPPTQLDVPQPTPKPKPKAPDFGF